MKQENIKNKLQERQEYIPARMKVITTLVQKVICLSSSKGLAVNPEFDEF